MNFVTHFRTRNPARKKYSEWWIYLSCFGCCVKVHSVVSRVVPLHRSAHTQPFVQRQLHPPPPPLPAASFANEWAGNRNRRSAAPCSLMMVLILWIGTRRLSFLDVLFNHDVDGVVLRIFFNPFCSVVYISHKVV